MNPTRKTLPHHPPVERHDRPTLLMVTTCVKDRRPLLANPVAHGLLRDAWSRADRWQVNRYMIMPDHVHFFCSPADHETAFTTWCSYWRHLATRAWPTSSEKPLWQKDNWDTQIRTSSGFTEKWHYIRNNPVRKNLVARPEDWTYQGQLHPFVWIER